MKRMVFLAATLGVCGVVASCTEPPPSDPTPTTTTTTTTTVAPAPLQLDAAHLDSTGPYEGFVAGARCPDAYTHLGTEVAQTFVAGVTGNLERISVPLYSYFGVSPEPLSVTVHAVEPDGSPSATELGRGTYSGLGLGEWIGSVPSSSLIDIDLATPAAVTAGQTYAIRFAVEQDCPGGDVPAPYPSWVMRTSFRQGVDPYVDGAVWTRYRDEDSNTDWRFRDAADLDYFYDIIFQTWVRPTS